ATVTEPEGTIDPPAPALAVIVNDCASESAGDTHAADKASNAPSHAPRPGRGHGRSCCLAARFGGDMEGRRSSEPRPGYSHNIATPRSTWEARFTPARVPRALERRRTPRRTGVWGRHGGARGGRAWVAETPRRYRSPRR